MPVLVLLLGGINISNKSFTIGHAMVKWGMFLQTVIDFTIIAFCIFVFIKVINSLQQKEEAVPAKQSEEIILLTQIRDLLANSRFPK